MLDWCPCVCVLSGVHLNVTDACTALLIFLQMYDARFLDDAGWHIVIVWESSIKAAFFPFLFINFMSYIAVPSALRSHGTDRCPSNTRLFRALVDAVSAAPAIIP
ncbi:hypothetical protein TcG_09371 [Trypanosoma cruzi]|nr:hypothetical protein TcG_09371 [Trypanosoma cruzi]